MEWNSPDHSCVYTYGTVPNESTQESQLGGAEVLSGGERCYQWVLGRSGIYRSKITLLHYELFRPVLVV